MADKASAAIGGKKTELTDGLNTVVDTVRRIGGAITDGEGQNTVTEHAAKYTETVANKLENIAAYFDKADLRGVAKDIESYARQNPAIFLGAAFALGVVAARFIKSSPSPRDIDGASAPLSDSMGYGQVRGSQKAQAASAAS